VPTNIFLRANDDRFLRCLNANVAVFNGGISLLACSLPLFVGVLSVMLRSITDVMSDDDLDEFEHWRLVIILREMAVHLSW
jgi:hypothetical protein